MPFRTPAFFRRREEPAAGAAVQPAAPAQRFAGGDDAMLDAAPLPPPHAGGQAGAGRGDGDAHAAALAADVLPDKQAIGSALGGLGAPPLFPLLPHEELLSDEERAISLQGFGAFGCVRRAGRRQVVAQAGVRVRPVLTARTPLAACSCKHYHRRARLVVPCCRGEVRGAAAPRHAVLRGRLRGRLTPAPWPDAAPRRAAGLLVPPLPQREQERAGVRRRRRQAVRAGARAHTSRKMLPPAHARPRRRSKHAGSRSRAARPRQVA